MNVRGTCPPLFIVTSAEIGNCQLELSSFGPPEAPVTVMDFTFTELDEPDDPDEPDRALVLEVVDELFACVVLVVSAGDVTLGGVEELDVCELDDELDDELVDDVCDFSSGRSLP